MPLEVFSEEWSAACRERLNANATYRAAAADWTDSVVLAMSPPERAVYLELSAGECRAARVASANDRSAAAIVLAASPAAWKQMMHGGLDPVTAVMRGALRLERGGVFALARYAAAAREMLAAAAAVGGAFPAATD